MTFQFHEKRMIYLINGTGRIQLGNKKLNIYLMSYKNKYQIYSRSSYKKVKKEKEKKH